MKSLTISTMALVLASLPAVAQAESRTLPTVHRGGGMGMPNMPKPGVNMPRPAMPGVGMPHVGGPRNWGGVTGGRWVGGMRAPGGWGAYRRPFVGYTLPSYWINPGFSVGNYWNYGFSRPAYGYGWSRYYDDAVLTDQSGRVQDYVEGVEWDRYEGGNAVSEDYADSYGYRDNGYSYGEQPVPERRKSGSGVAGAVIGGVVGAVAGSAVVGRGGDKTAGALIGGGLGALAGLAVNSMSGANRGYKTKRAKVKAPKRGRNADYDYGYDNRDNRAPAPVYDDGYDRDGGHWGSGATYPAPVYRPAPVYQPAPVYRHQQGAPVIVQHGGPSYGHGYYGGGETTTIVIQQSQPVVTTTTTTTEEIIYASAPRKRIAPRKVWRPRPKPRCVCKVVYR